MLRTTYDQDCDIGTEMIVEDKVYTILDKQQGLLKLRQKTYTLRYNDWSESFDSLSKLEEAYQDMLDNYDEPDYIVDEWDDGEEFWQHYKDMEEPDFFDVPDVFYW